MSFSQAINSINYSLAPSLVNHHDEEEESFNTTAGTAAQETAHVKSILIATIPKVPALLSITCSSLIIQKIIRSPTRRQNIFHRIMLGLSISDVFSSSVYFFGTWLVPKDSMTVGGYGPVYWAAGTTETCQLSGFFTQAAMAGPFYNATLACYYLLTIYYNWPDGRLKTVQHWFHILPIGWALMTSVIALVLKMYGNVDWLCWILPEDREDGTGTLAQRSFVVFQWVFLFGPLWCCIFFVSGVMFLLWKKMRENEKKMEKYRFSFSSTKRSGLDVCSDDNTTTNNNIVQSEQPERHWDAGGWKKSFLNIRQNNHNVTASSCSATSTAAPNAQSDWRSLRSKGVVVLIQKNSSLSASMSVSDTIDESTSGVVNESPLPIDESTSGVVNESPLPTPSSLTAHDSSNTKDQDVTSFTNDEIDHEDSTMTIYEFLSNSSTPEMSSSTVFTIDEEHGQNHITTDLNPKSSGVNQNSSSIPRASSFSSVRWSNLFREPSQRQQNEAAFSNRRLQLYNKASRSRQIAIQGMLYLCAFYVTWLFPTIKRLMELGNENSCVVQFLDSTLLPLQGLFNFIIYMRPRLTAYRRVNKDNGFWQALWNVVWE